jgi:hypothetical protein
MIRMTRPPDAVPRVFPVNSLHSRTAAYNLCHSRPRQVYVASGWQIGSGHIEAACKTVVNERLKRSGMRWGEDGADAVCHLRALFKGDAEQWDAFWACSIN